MNIILWLILGAIAGWLAGNIMRGGGFGLVGNIIVGIVGSLIGGYLAPYVGLPATGSFSLGSLITAVIGAVILLFILGLIRR